MPPLFTYVSQRTVRETHIYHNRPICRRRTVFDLRRETNDRTAGGFKGNPKCTPHHYTLQNGRP